MRQLCHIAVVGQVQHAVDTGDPLESCTTEDFVAAANGLRTQHDTHTNAKIRPESETLSGALGALVTGEVRKVLDNSKVDLREDGVVVKVEENVV